MLLSRPEAEQFYSLYLSGLRLTKSDRILINSPFRDERVASFEISLNNGLWYDYGSGHGGDIIDFMCMADGLSARDAMVKYEAISGHDVVMTVVRPVKVSRVIAQHNVSTSKLPTYNLNWLNENSIGAIKPLRDRGIIKPDMDRLGLYTFKNNGHDAVLVATEVDGDEVVRYKLFTYTDKKKITLTRGKATLYPSSMLRHSALILCEGELDAAAVIAGGYNAITGTSGAGTFMDEWKYALAKKTILVVYDNDLAGLTGTDKVVESLHGWAKAVIRFEWDQAHREHYDISDYLMEGGQIINLIGDYYETVFRSTPIR